MLAATLITIYAAALCYATVLAAVLISDELADRRTRRADAHRLTSGGSIHH